MSQFFVIHPENPQDRLIKRAAKIVQDGGLIVYPTDSAYAVGCQIANKGALDRIRSLRAVDEKHYFTLVCRSLSEMSTYGVIDNATFRILKATTPGPYTFILKATPEVPKRLADEKRKTIGLRIPDNKIVQALLEELDGPLMSMSLILPNQEFPFVNAEEIHQRLCRQIDVIIDGGRCSATPTTIVDLVTGKPTILREGKGDPSVFE